ncbi:MAG: GTPase ObgE [Sediminispirochaetaceae bacterium]
MIGFADEVYIDVASGNGGNGCVSFRREKYVPKGGPDGGDGGTGGSVIFEVRQNLKTLSHLKTKRSYKAENGESGKGKQRHGRNGENVVIPVPPGTLIKDPDTGKVLRDLTDVDEQWIIYRGGKGGKGNMHYATSRRQVPRYAQPGEPGVTGRLHVELHIIADIGFVGLPNAGKSSLLSVLTNAHPKIAAYAFTTKTPNLGVLRYKYRDIILADIPGIIEGASHGAGLGDKFLKHIARTSGLAIMLDLTDENIIHTYGIVLKELEHYAYDMLRKPRIILGTKLDLPGTKDVLEQFASEMKDEKVIGVSSFSSEGLEEVKAAFHAMVHTHLQADEADRSDYSEPEEVT